MIRRWLGAGVVLAALGGLAGYAALSAIEAPGPLAERRDVVVPRGGSSQVAETLRRAGVLNAGWPFRAAAALTAWDGPLRSAEFSFPPRASLAAVLTILRHGRPVQHKLTVPEGLTAWRIGLLLGQAGALAGEIDVPDEGTILPESYAYAFGTPADAVLQRARRAMDDVLGEAWRGRLPGLRLRSPWELLILASLVERETHLSSERRLVARVFLNRLEHGMRLQSDPTVVYAESGGVGELPVGLTRDALARASPYNTYAVMGLPTGPICAPGRASIDAAAHPASSDALYFVADGTGGHVFADSLAEHVRNVDRYRALSR